jgi:hypothetical protein
MTNATQMVKGWASDLAANFDVALAVATVNNGRSTERTSRSQQKCRSKCCWASMIPTDLAMQPDDLDVQVFNVMIDGRSHELEYISPFFKRQ